MRKKTYTEDQIELLRKYYPDGRWDMILPIFPNKSKANIRALARKHGISRDREFYKDLDLTGQRLGILTALHVESKDRDTRWLCKCDCGNECSVSVYLLMSGGTKSCGCLKHKPAVNAKDFSGQKFGLLTAVEKLPHYKNDETYYRCICECGNEKIASASNLKTGHIRTCGADVHKKSQFRILNIPKDDNAKNYYVYRHVSPSGKSYIGITKQKPERRFQNGFGYKTQDSFFRAIAKYGWDNFTHEILEEGLTEKEACEKEAYYIDLYNSFSPNGYNTREGGISGRNKVTPIIQYYQDKPVNYFEGISVASELLGVAQKTIHIHCGKENAIGGYYFEQLEPIEPYNIEAELLEIRDESHFVFKDLIAQDTKATVLQRNKRCSKPVNKYTLEGKYICTYSSLAEAKNSIPNSDGEGVGAAVNPNRAGQTAYGFMWKYDDGYYGDISHVQYKAQKAVVKVDVMSGEVLDEYQSMAQAAKSLGVSLQKIRSECSGRRRHFTGFTLGYKWS
jgi:group I intron endonuclease